MGDGACVGARAGFIGGLAKGAAGGRCRLLGARGAGRSGPARGAGRSGPARGRRRGRARALEGSSTAGRAGGAGNWAACGRAAGRSRRGRAGRWAWDRGALGVGARGAWPGRAAWAPGLALGCALGALGPFSIRFDSVFFMSQLLDIVRKPGS